MTDLDDAVLALRREARTLPPGALRRAAESATAGSGRHASEGLPWMKGVVAGPAPCAACGRGRLWLVRLTRDHCFPVLGWREHAYGIHLCPEPVA